MSPKSTELLNNALNVFKQNDIHMLVRGGARMSGFLDTCKQSSAILVPFFFNWDSLHTRLNSHFEAWAYKKKKHKKIKEHGKSV